MKNYFIKKSTFLALSWTLIISILCCTPGKYIPHSNWLELLSFDKLVHAGMFFILTSFWNLVLVKNKKIIPIYKMLVIIGCIGYGGTLELLQSFYFSGRSGDWYDFIANTFGVFMAWFVFQKINNLQNH
jgi:VanZ family protein